VNEERRNEMAYKISAGVLFTAFFLAVMLIASV
jgi:hypothetical protein